MRGSRTVYPGAPEPTNFGEDDPGNVALVFFFRRQRRPRIERLPVAHWRWEEQTVTSLAELRALAIRTDLQSVVMRLRVTMDVTLAEEADVQRLLTELSGTDATRGKVGVLVIDKQLTLRTDDRSWLASVPESMRPVAERIEELRARALGQGGDSSGDRDSDTGATASAELYDRVLTHLYRLLRERGALEPASGTDGSGGER